MSKEEIEKVNKILSCDNCPTSYACEGCDITQTDKLLIKKYISSLLYLDKSEKTIDIQKLEYIDELEYSVMGTFVNSEKKVVNELIKAVKQLDEQLRKIQNYVDIMDKEKIGFERDMLKKGQVSLMSSRKKWKDRYYKLRKMFNKQSKIIDEMAKEINKAYFDENNFYLWFEKNIIYETSCLSDRIVKIKQYFEKKVEGK